MESQAWAGLTISLQGPRADCVGGVGRPTMSDHDRATHRHGRDDSGSAAGAIAPGKRTLSGMIQRKAAPAAMDAPPPSAAAAEPAAPAERGDEAFWFADGPSASGGEALPDALRGKFEQSLGADLGGVRIHTGERSADAAASLHAQAYTLGQDIHFGAGTYDPSSRAGEELLAHEV